MTAPVTLTTFPRLRDTRPTVCHIDPAELIEHDARKIKDGPLISPAIYERGAKRGSIGIEHLTAIFLDYDNEGADLDAVLQNLAGLEHCYYTTHSHKPDAPKFRVLLPLAMPASLKDWHRIHNAAARLAGLAGLDPSCNSPARAYYAASCPPEMAVYARAGYQAGRRLSVAELLELEQDQQARTAPGAKRKQGGIIELANDAYTVRALVEGQGHTRCGTRYRHRDSQSGEPGIVVFEDGGQDYYYSHHSPTTDPLADGHRHDAFDLLLHWRYGGDMRRAIKELAAELDPQGRTREPRHDQADDGTGKAARFTLLSSSDLRDRPAFEWTVKGLLPSRGIGQCFGPSMSSKSFLKFDMGAAVAGDSADWFGHRISTHRPVVYIALEGQHGVRQRAEAWELHHGRPLPDDFHIVLDPLKITDPSQVEELAAVCPKGSLVIIDTQNCAAPGADENSSKDMGLIIEGAKQLERLTEGFVLLVAHTGKDASKGPRGHSSQIPAADLVIEVTRDGDRREWIARKVKDGKDGARHPFALKVIELGFDDDGDEITSCVIDPDVALSAPKKLMTESQRQGMASFRIAAETDGLLDDDDNFAGLHLEAWRAKFYELSTADTPAAKQKAFSRVRRDLVELEKVSVKNDVYRLAGPTAGLEESEFARCLAGHGH